MGSSGFWNEVYFTTAVKNLPITFSVPSTGEISVRARYTRAARQSDCLRHPHIQLMLPFPLRRSSCSHSKARHSDSGMASAIENNMLLLMEIYNGTWNNRSNYSFIGFHLLYFASSNAIRSGIYSLLVVSRNQHTS